MANLLSLFLLLLGFVFVAQSSVPCDRCNRGWGWKSNKQNWIQKNDPSFYWPTVFVSAKIEKIPQATIVGSVTEHRVFLYRLTQAYVLNPGVENNPNGQQYFMLMHAVDSAYPPYKQCGFIHTGDYKTIFDVMAESNERYVFQLRKQFDYVLYDQLKPEWRALTLRFNARDAIGKESVRREQVFAMQADNCASVDSYTVDPWRFPRSCASISVQRTGCLSIAQTKVLAELKTKHITDAVVNRIDEAGCNSCIYNGVCVEGTCSCSYPFSKNCSSLENEVWCPNAEDIRNGRRSGVSRCKPSFEMATATPGSQPDDVWLLGTTRTVSFQLTGLAQAGVRRLFVFLRSRNAQYRCWVRNDDDLALWNVADRAWEQRDLFIDLGEDPVQFSAPLAEILVKDDDSGVYTVEVPSLGHCMREADDVRVAVFGVASTSGAPNDQQLLTPLALGQPFRIAASSCVSDEQSRIGQCASAEQCYRMSGGIDAAPRFAAHASAHCFGTAVCCVPVQRFEPQTPSGWTLNSFFVTPRRETVVYAGEPIDIEVAGKLRVTPRNSFSRFVLYNANEESILAGELRGEEGTTHRNDYYYTKLRWSFVDDNGVPLPAGDYILEAQAGDNAQVVASVAFRVEPIPCRATATGSPLIGQCMPRSTNCASGLVSNQQQCDGILADSHCCYSRRNSNTGFRDDENTLADDAPNKFLALSSLLLFIVTALTIFSQ